MVIFASVFMALMGFGLIAMSLGSLVSERRRIKSLLDTKYDSDDPSLESMCIKADLKDSAVAANVENLITREGIGDFQKSEREKFLEKHYSIYNQNTPKEESGSHEAKVRPPLTVDTLLKEALILNDIVNKIGTKYINEKEVGSLIDMKKSTDEKKVPSENVKDLVYSIELVKYTADAMLKGIENKPKLFVESAEKKGIDPEEYVNKLKVVVKYTDESFETLNSTYADALKAVGTKVDVIKELLKKDPKEISLNSKYIF